MKIQPIGDRVIVLPDAKMGQTASGIYIPETSQEKPQKGIVMAVGPGAVNYMGKVIKPQVKAGDRVLYGKFAGTEITEEGKEYLIMRELDLYAIL